MSQDSSMKRIWQNPSLYPPEEILKELESLLRSNPDFWLKISKSGILVDFKPSRFIQVETNLENSIGQNIEDVLPDSLKAIAIEAISYLSQEKNQIFWKEYSFGEGNHKRYAEVRFVDLNDGYVMSTHRDITERKRLELAFLESESRFLSMAQSAAESIITFGEDGQIQFFNKSAESTFGYQQSDILGKNINLIFRSQEAEFLSHELQKFLQMAQKEGQGLDQEILAQKKTGEIFPCELSIGEFQTKSGRTFTCILRDISSRKMQEQEIYQYRNHLEELVEKQTVDLRLAKNMAEEASYMKSLFLANISHELKTPIHAILSYAELGLEKSFSASPEKLKEYFQIIDSSGKRLLGLLDNLLDLAKLESGKMRYLFERNCLKETVIFVVNELRAILEKRKITVILPDSQDRWEAEFDFERIQQVVRNILSNALKFVPNETSIEVTMVQREFIPRKSTQYVPGIGLQIRDHGSGIPTEDLDKIFEKFIQSKQVKAGTKGTGLGLSISREIVNDHSGLLYAENHDEGGAVFTMLIPKSRILPPT